MGHQLAELLVASPWCKTGRARPFIGRVLPTRSAALDGAAMDGVLWLDQYKCLRVTISSVVVIFMMIQFYHNVLYSHIYRILFM